MSRYEFDGGLAIGWDPPLETFFVSVFDKEDEELYCSKFMPNAITNIEKLKLEVDKAESFLKIKFNITEKTYLQLYQDMIYSDKPTEIQEFFRKFL